MNRDFRSVSKSGDRLVMRFLSGLALALGLRVRDKTLELESILGHHFKNRELLELALTHRSRAGWKGSNEQLELLGDAVLGLVAVEYLLDRFPLEKEGTLTKRRSYLVSRRHLARKARDLGLARFVRLGKGEKAAGVGKLPSVRADTMEAVLGAVYLDGGLNAARKVALRLIFHGHDVDAWETSNPKSTLQELVQHSGDPPPTYVVVGEHGPEGKKLFEVEVRVGGRSWGKGTGRSKKQAQQAAAASALERHGGT